MDNEEFEEYISSEDRRIVQEMIREKEKAFSQGCREGFKLIEEHGTDAIENTDQAEAKEALNRMLGYFIQMEEYEKCSLIRKVYQEAFKGDTSPIFPNFLLEDE